MILLNPGPVNVSPRVQKALLRGDICHREEDFSRLLQDIREKLLAAFAPHGGYTAILLTGSGTAAVEAGVSSCVEEGKKILVASNGVYGERISRIAQAYKIKTVVMSAPWTERPSLAKIEKALKKDKAIQVVALVHHETTTGLINPVTEVGTLARKYGKVFLVDSVSGLGGEEIDLKQDGIDVCLGTAQKCIQGLPGISFVVVTRTGMKRMEKIRPRSLYLSLASYYRDQEKSTVPFTPAVQMCYALDEALSELLEEGVAKRIERYRKASRFLREGFAEMGLRFLLPEPLRSNTITSLYLPRGMTYKHLHDSLREAGYVIYAGQGTLSNKVFRVANMGALSPSDFDGFLHALRSVL